MADVMNITVLEDGTIKSETVGHVSMPNHQSAEQFLADTAKLAGGAVSRTKIGHGHAHGSHSGGHTHGHSH